MKLKPYPKCKDSGVQWIGKIPEGWEVKRLRFNALVNPSGKKALSNPKTLVNFLPMEKVSENGEYEQESEAEYQDVSTGYTYFEDNDVLVAKITPCFENGKGALVNNLKFGFGFGTTEFHVIRSYSQLMPKYLFYLTKTHLFRVTGEAFMEGAAGQKRVSTDFIKDFMMATPPLPDQTNIASFLDKRTARIDVLIEKDKKLIALLKEKRTALINHAVTKGLDPNVKLKDSGIPGIGKIPEGWEVVPLKKYLESFVDYRGATPEKTDEGIFLVTGKNIKEGKINYELSKEYVFEDQYEEVMHRGKPKIGDLLFTTEAPLGEVANVDYEKIALAQRIIKIRGKKQKLDNFYLKYYIMTQLFQSHLQSLATGSTALGLKASNWCFLRLIVPPLPEQIPIAEFLDNATSKIDKTIQKIEEKVKLLEEYKKSLIHHVVTGKVDVRKSEI